MNDKVAQAIQDRDYAAGECATSWNEAGEHTRDYYRETAKLVLSAETDTHELRIVKKGDPPLLSDLELSHINMYVPIEMQRELAEGQRSSDIEYYNEKV